jgi:4-hydroxybenzoate polyprenyltransferase
VTLRTALTLCRIPNVFTAFANVVAGVVVARGGCFEAGDVRLVLASGLLYCAGMVLNDFFDREIDARERPERPIPSGAATPAGVALFGGLLLFIGLALAISVSPRSGAVGVALAAAILVYDGGAKQTLLGPVSMGACRFLNVALGLTVAGFCAPDWGWIGAGIMFVYTTLITYLARDEVGGSTAARLSRGAAFLGVLLIVFFLALTFSASAKWAALPFFAFVALRGLVLFEPLTFSTSGRTIGRAIGGGILMMPAIDATVVAGAGYFGAAVIVFALSLPAYLLKRMFYVT